MIECKLLLRINKRMSEIRYLTGCDPWINLNTSLFCLFSEPLNKLIETNDVIPMVVQYGWTGQGEGVVLGEEKHFIFERRLMEWSLIKSTQTNANTFLSFQSGISSFNARGSKTAPESV